MKCHKCGFENEENEKVYTYSQKNNDNFEEVHQIEDNIGTVRRIDLCTTNIEFQYWCEKCVDYYSHLCRNCGQNVSDDNNTGVCFYCGKKLT